MNARMTPTLFVWLLITAASWLSPAIRAAPSTVPPTSGVEFTILHNNDMHSRFEQTGKYSNQCPDEEALTNKCYGGFARVSTVLKRFRNQAQNGGPPVLYLNAGDTYTGTPWFTLYRDKITSDFLNILKPDAVSLGNHEFDYGVAGLLPMLNAVNFPMLVSNLKVPADHPLLQTKALKKSVVFDINGTKVGVIGYLTPETRFLTPPNDVEYISEIEAINEEAAALKNRGVNILIALGHSGYDVDQQIGIKCPDIDVVVGGHSNTFLYNGRQPDVESIDGPYPTVVTQKSGKKVPVVQAYAYTKYLGHLKLKFDNEGNLLEWNGEPILLDGSVQHDPAVLQLLEKYRPGIVAERSNIAGTSKVFLNGRSCRLMECNLGNLVTDAMVHANALLYAGKNWTDAGLAFMQGGGVRASAYAGNISRYDLITMFPFNSSLYKIDISGEELLAALEHSVARYNGGNGEFLQMSGVHVVYDLRQPSGRRVKSVQVVCRDCEVPAYSPLELKKMYGLIITDFTYEGGDGYTMFKKSNSTKLPLTEFEAVDQYFHDFRTVYPAVEWRITLEGQVNEGDGNSATAARISMGLIVMTVLLNIFSNN